MREGRYVGIKGYTLTQFERFSEAIERRRTRDRADRIEDTAYAARTIFAKLDVLQSLVKSFRESAQKRPARKSKGKSRQKKAGRESP